MSEFMFSLELDNGSFGFGFQAYRDGPFNTGRLVWQVYLGFFTAHIIPTGKGFHFRNDWRSKEARDEA
jgi:hypothetical protein